MLIFFIDYCYATLIFVTLDDDYAMPFVYFAALHFLFVSLRCRFLRYFRHVKGTTPFTFI